VKGQISNGIIMQPTFGIEKMRQFANRLGFAIIPHIFGLHKGEGHCPYQEP
jgi:hypothetical protein